MEGLKLMQIKISPYKNDENEKNNAKAYWSEQNNQQLDYELKSHYVTAIAEIINFINAKNIFEFGCAAGRNLKSLQEIFADDDECDLIVSGIDINELAVKQGQDESGLDISLADEAYLDKISSDAFELVFTVSVLDHVPAPSDIVKKLMNITSEYGVFIEPWVGSDSSELGKINNIMTRWSRSKDDSSNPFTYIHDYPSIFEEADCEVIFRVPLPTHLNRSGPLYYLWFVSKSKNSLAKVNNLKDKIISTACLQLLENIQKLRLKANGANELERLKNVFSKKSYELQKKNNALNEKIEESKAKAKESKAKAKESEAKAKESEAKAKESEAKAKESEAKAKESEAKAKESEAKAKESEAKAKESEAKAKMLNTKAYKLGKINNNHTQIIESLKKSVAIEKNNLKLIQDSSSYRIGRVFARDAIRLLHWPLIPIKIYQIYKLHKQKKVQRKDTSTSTEQATSQSSTSAFAKESDILQELFDSKKTPQDSVDGRICYMLHNSLPYASGGYATRSHGVAVSLKSQGYDVQVVTRTGYPLDVKDTDITVGEDSVIDGIQYTRLLAPVIRGNTLQNYMKDSIEAYVEHFKLVRPAYVMAASSFRHALPAIIAAKRLAIPTIYEVRGFWEVTRISREPSFESSKAYEYQVKMEAETAKAADQVFTLTMSMKEELVKRGVTASNIAITPNACEPTEFSPRNKNNNLRAKLEIPEDVPVIGYIGSWVHYEGLDDLVRACKLLFDKGIKFRCLIVGSENVANDSLGPIYDELMGIIKDTKLADWVITPGRVPFAEVSKYYSLIDIAPFPRKPLPVTEMVSPMKPLEALAMEKAVVVSNVGALDEMIEDGKTGLVFQKGNIRDLADKLELLIKDGKLRSLLGTNGRRHIVNERNWKNVSHLMSNSLSDLDSKRITSDD